MVSGSFATDPHLVALRVFIAARFRGPESLVEIEPSGRPHLADLQRDTSRCTPPRDVCRLLPIMPRYARNSGPHRVFFINRRRWVGASGPLVREHLQIVALRHGAGALSRIAHLDWRCGRAGHFDRRRSSPDAVGLHQSYVALVRGDASTSTDESPRGSTQRHVYPAVAAHRLEDG